jgi:methionyl-tRNA formyltransferase
MKIVFMGSTEFGIPALKLLLSRHAVVGIVTTPPRPKGRGRAVAPSPVAQFAQAVGVGPVFSPSDLKNPLLFSELAACNADLFIVAAFRILPKCLFSLPPLGTINIHASLLPKYRGPAPIQRAIEAGETETGITIFRIDEGIDTGMILLQKRVPIGPEETSEQLFGRLSDLGANALIETIDRIDSGAAIPMRQDHVAASGAPKLTKREGAINWHRSSQAIFNKIRAFKPFPGAFAVFEGKRLGIEAAQPLLGRAIATTAMAVPGTVVAVGDGYFDVQCLQGCLRVLEVKPANRRRMSVHDFLLGTRMKEGTAL